MSDLVIRIKKKTDGSAALSCTRADGSVTWQRQVGQLGRFFPLHDLTHYSVESVLGFRRAFFGLLAEGWDISDFGGPGIGARLPDEAHLAEVIVGFFDLERMVGAPGIVADCNERIVNYFAEMGRADPDFRLSDDDAARVRDVRAELFERWRALAPGNAMEVPFDRAAAMRSA